MGRVARWTVGGVCALSVAAGGAGLVLSTFPDGNPGTRSGAICQDAATSSATGSGACSHHGGVDHWLYVPGSGNDASPLKSAAWPLALSGGAVGYWSYSRLKRSAS